MNSRKVWVLCPFGLITGGGEALHQMVFYLRKQRIDAELVYTDITDRKRSVPDCYRIYTERYSLMKDIEDVPGDCVVVPETLTHLLKGFAHLKKYIWWLSVGNDTQAGFADKARKIARKLFSLQTVRQLYKIRTLRNYLRHRTYDFSDGSVSHLCASHYAYDYVKRHTDAPAHLCIEPISYGFLHGELLTAEKEDIVLYNPKKNGAFTKKLMRRNRDLKFLPLQKMDQRQLSEHYARAKVYIDFGGFPGAERIPKEAVLHRCAILTGVAGASAFFEDVPIPGSYKIPAEEENLGRIADRIRCMLDQYEALLPDFDGYRRMVLSLEENFCRMLRMIFQEEEDA